MSDDHIGVKVNGVLYVRLEDARKLREGWDKADERIAELEAAVYQYINHVVSYEGVSFIDVDQPWAKLMNETWEKQAALKGGK